MTKTYTVEYDRGNSRRRFAINELLHAIPSGRALRSLLIASGATRESDPDMFRIADLLSKAGELAEKELGRR